MASSEEKSGMDEQNLDTDGAVTETLDDEPRSILMALISQLRIGMDLHKVTLPTFVLEPRSMLERITDFMSHPDILFEAVKQSDPMERFLRALKFYLSGWHIRPKGVKKPYNPALGEIFRCRWQFEDNTEAFYIAEQVSHHPPVSAFYYSSPENRATVHGEFRPKSKFLGNSAATLMHGGSKIRFMDYPDEVYEVTNPNVYARGLLFGTMLMELGDTAKFQCSATGIVAELEFITKGFFTGKYNGVRGKIKMAGSNTVLYDIDGTWTDVINIKKHKSNEKSVLFDVASSSIHKKIVLSLEDQEAYESRKLWSKLTRAILNRNMDDASEAKSAVEDRQRTIRKEKEAAKDIHRTRFFDCIDDKWTFKHDRDLFFIKDSAEAKEKLRNIIYAKADS